MFCQVQDSDILHARAKAFDCYKYNGGQGFAAVLGDILRAEPSHIIVSDASNLITLNLQRFLQFLTLRQPLECRLTGEI